MDSVSRFSNRVESYARYRPRYPLAVIDCLAANYGLTPTQRVADVGSGTGILTELFLQHGNVVDAVEPNAAMRAAAEALLAAYPGFHSVDGRSEATTLPDASVDWITAGQAFHWFEPVATRAEFQRILKPDGRVVLVWNSRREDGTPFLRGYAELLDEFSADYRQVDHKYVSDDDAVRRFFAPAACTLHAFANQQVLDFDGVVGRITSTSYAPAPGSPQYAPMVARLRALFDACQQEGRVVMEYDTRLYVGNLQ